MRIQSNGFGFVGDGLVIVALLMVGESPIVVCHHIIRFEPDGLAVIGDGPVIVAFEIVGKPPVVIGAEIIRLEADGFAEVGNGEVVILLTTRFLTVLKGCREFGGLVCLSVPAPLARP